jgi:hypothetical protein
MIVMHGKMKKNKDGTINKISFTEEIHDEKD